MLFGRSSGFSVILYHTWFSHWKWGIIRSISVRPAHTVSEEPIMRISAQFQSHTASLKLTTVGMFTPLKSANATKGCFSQKVGFSIMYQHTTVAGRK